MGFMFVIMEYFNITKKQLYAVKKKYNKKDEGELPSVSDSKEPLLQWEAGQSWVEIYQE